MHTLIKSITAIAVTGLLASLPAQAFADENSYRQSPLAPDRTKTVSAADLDMSKPEDVRTLYQRINSAARALCETEHSAVWDVKQLLHKRQCSERGVENAVNSVDQPELTALHLGVRARLARL